MKDDSVDSIKRQRGRPRKEVNDLVVSEPKRPRGRPRKIVADVNNNPPITPKRDLTSENLSEDDRRYSRPILGPSKDIHTPVVAHPQLSTTDPIISIFDLHLTKFTDLHYLIISLERDLLFHNCPKLSEDYRQLSNNISNLIRKLKDRARKQKK